MGLMVHSLSEIPENITRSYYIYLLDFGWEEPLAKIIYDNYSKIADLSSKNNAVFITGVVGSHVDNEILSWHNINGERGEDILPALFITTENPHTFKGMDFSSNIQEFNSKIILIPLKECCSTASEVVSLIDGVFKDITNKCELKNFKVRKEMKKSGWKRLLDGVILQPNFSGVGFDLKKFFGK